MPPFQVNKFKVELKLAINRLKLLQAKKSTLNLKARREIAPLLESGKIESATIRVENIIREDLNVEALEMVELFCELLTARVGLIDQSRTIDPGVSEVVHSVIYASSRIDVREVTMLREMLTAKFGKEVVVEAMENKAGLVNAKLVRKLSVDTPPDSLIKMYLAEIAGFYQIKWRPDGQEEVEEEDGPPGSGSDQDTSPGSGGLTEPAVVVDEAPSEPESVPSVKPADVAATA
ncbi:transcriptional repressor general negative regulator of transcription subunit 4, partial [Coemansia aciculifera]